MTNPKRISQADITGQQGINLIERIVLEMGWLWHPTGLEAGIDGYVEVRDPQTGDVTNCILQVQSKATKGAFDSEKGDSFCYYCDERDLTYWLHGNSPVILIRSRPATGEAYWASIKDRFQDPKSRVDRKLVFKKTQDRFDANARSQLAALAVPKDSGLYLSPPPRIENLESNLLHIRDFPETYFVAPTVFSSAKDLNLRLKEIGVRVGPAWIVRERQIYSLYDLRAGKWSQVCDATATEELPLEDWAFTDDDDWKRSFVDLLSRAVQETLYHSGVGYDPWEKHYYFWSTSDASDRIISFRSRLRNSKRTVFKAYKSKTNPERISYCRHYAFEGKPKRLGDRWFLEINPTYRFTLSDGRTRHHRAHDLLAGIKRLDGALAVANMTVMWADYIAQEDLFNSFDRLLGFGSLAKFEVEAGINDVAWIKQEEDANRFVSSVDNDDDELILS